jgi:scyllo-inositol 2-dehydrogenase (NADP+)
MQQPLSVALVGYGFAGRIFHAPLIDAEPRLRLAAVVSSRPDAVHADLPDVAVLPDLSALPPAVRLVVIATPNESHAPLAAQALALGRHVVVDKPFTLTAAEADRLIDLAAAAALQLTVFHNRRWDSDFRTLQQLVKAGELGDVVTAALHFDRYRPVVRNRWREQALPGSGLLYDLGAHLIDQAVTLLGPPDAVWADLGRQRPGARSDDFVHLVLRFGEQRAILHAGSLVVEGGDRIAVHGTQGSFLKRGLDPQEAALKAGQRPGDPGWGADPPENQALLAQPAGRDATTTRAVPSLPGAYERFYAGVAAALLEGAPLPVTALQGRNVVAVIEAAQASAATGRLIALPPRWRT